MNPATAFIHVFFSQQLQPLPDTHGIANSHTMYRHISVALAVVLSLSLVACAGISPLERYRTGPDYDPSRFDDGFHLRTYGDLRPVAPIQEMRLEVSDSVLRDSIIEIVSQAGIRRAESDSRAPKLIVRTGYLVQNNEFGIDGHQGLAMNLADAIKNDYSFNDLRPLRCDKKPIDGEAGDGLRANAGNIAIWLSQIVGGPLAQTAIAATGIQAASAKRPGQLDPCQQLSYYMPDSSARFKETITTEFSLEQPNRPVINLIVSTVRNRKGHDPKEVLDQHKRDLGSALSASQKDRLGGSPTTRLARDGAEL